MSFFKKIKQDRIVERLIPACDKPTLYIPLSCLKLYELKIANFLQKNSVWQDRITQKKLSRQMKCKFQIKNLISQEVQRDYIFLQQKGLRKNYISIGPSSSSQKRDLCLPIKQTLTIKISRNTYLNQKIRVQHLKKLMLLSKFLSSLPDCYNQTHPYIICKIREFIYKQENNFSLILNPKTNVFYSIKNQHNALSNKLYFLQKDCLYLQLNCDQPSQLSILSIRLFFQSENRYILIQQKSLEVASNSCISVHQTFKLQTKFYLTLMYGLQKKVDIQYRRSFGLRIPKVKFFKGRSSIQGWSVRGQQAFWFVSSLELTKTSGSAYLLSLKKRQKPKLEIGTDTKIKINQYAIIWQLSQKKK